MEWIHYEARYFHSRDLLSLPILTVAVICFHWDTPHTHDWHSSQEHSLLV